MSYNGCVYCGRVVARLCKLGSLRGQSCRHIELHTEPQQSGVGYTSTEYSRGPLAKASWQFHLCGHIKSNFITWLMSLQWQKYSQNVYLLKHVGSKLENWLVYYPNGNVFLHAALGLGGVYTRIQPRQGHFLAKDLHICVWQAVDKDRDIVPGPPLTGHIHNHGGWLRNALHVPHMTPHCCLPYYCCCCCWRNLRRCIQHDTSCTW